MISSYLVVKMDVGFRRILVAVTKNVQSTLEIVPRVIDGIGKSRD